MEGGRVLEVQVMDTRNRMVGADHPDKLTTCTILLSPGKTWTDMRRASDLVEERVRYEGVS
jgi:hypothetical protein